MRNGPHIYINYMEDGRHVSRGPYFTVSPDGVDPMKWVAYKVQDATGCFDRITVPYYHSISAVVSSLGLDIH